MILEESLTWKECRPQSKTTSKVRHKKDDLKVKHFNQKKDIKGMKTAEEYDIKGKAILMGRQQQ